MTSEQRRRSTVVDGDALLVRRWCERLLSDAALLDALSSRDVALQVLVLTESSEPAAVPTYPRRRIRRRQ